jgi:hypothetical protein
MSTPTSVHYSHLLHVPGYLCGTIDRHLFFSSSSSLQLHAYSDATWGSDPTDSLYAYYVFLGSTLITSKTKKHTVVSRSSGEAELCALAYVTTEVTWLRWFMAYFGVALSSSTHVHYDKTSVISIAQDPVKHELIKHIRVDCFYVWSTIQDKIIALQYVSSEIQLADLPKPILELNIIFFFSKIKFT